MWDFIVGALVMGVGVFIGFVITNVQQDRKNSTTVNNTYGKGNVKVLLTDEPQE